MTGWKGEKMKYVQEWKGHKQRERQTENEKNKKYDEKRRRGSRITPASESLNSAL